MKDLKEALGSARKPDITHVRGPLMNYVARACEYGSAKYQRSNFARPASEHPPGSPAAVRADFERLRAYIRATVSHGVATLDAMEAHQAGDPELVDIAGMMHAAFAADTDAKPGCAVGASFLPHLSHMAASLNMALTQAATYGLLPADPGTPWTLRQLPAAGETAGECEQCERDFDCEYDTYEQAIERYTNSTAAGRAAINAQIAAADASERRG